MMLIDHERKLRAVERIYDAWSAAGNGDNADALDAIGLALQDCPHSEIYVVTFTDDTLDEAHCGVYTSYEGADARITREIAQIHSAQNRRWKRDEREPDTPLADGARRKLLTVYSGPEIDDDECRWYGIWRECLDDDGN